MSQVLIAHGAQALGRLCHAQFLHLPDLDAGGNLIWGHHGLLGERLARRARPHTLLGEHRVPRELLHAAIHLALIWHPWHSGRRPHLGRRVGVDVGDPGHARLPQVLLCGRVIRQGAGAEASHRHPCLGRGVAVNSLAPRVHAQRVLARPQRDVKVRIRWENPLLLARVVRDHHHGPAALAGGGWGHARAQRALQHGWVRGQHAVVGRRSWDHLVAVTRKGLLHGCGQRDTLAQIHPGNMAEPLETAALSFFHVRGASPLCSL